MVAKIFLDRFYIITTPKDSDSIRMTKIVEPSIRAVDFCDQLLKMEVHSLRREVASQLIREYKPTRIAPCLTCI